MSEPLTPIPNVGSQLDRAIVAYLISVGVGSVEDVFPSHSIKAKKYPCTVVKAFQSSHFPENSGNEIYQVQIQFRQSASNKPGETNPEAKRVAVDNYVGLGMAAMMQSDDSATLDYTARAITSAGRALVDSDPENNSDMASFSLTHIYFKGATRGEPDEENSSWVEIRTFECHACASNVD